MLKDKILIIKPQQRLHTDEANKITKLHWVLTMIKTIKLMDCKGACTSRASENLIYKNKGVKYRNMIKPYKIN